MLYRRGGKRGANFRKQGFALVAFGVINADLDEFVGRQAAVDFFENGFRQPFLADADDRAEGMGAGAQGAARGGCDSGGGGGLCIHTSIVTIRGRVEEE